MMNPLPAAAVDDDPPRRVRAGYGVAELGINGVEVLIRVGLLIFYTDAVGLDPALAGYAVAIGVLWDAVTDPLMGRISDRSRSRFGRRRVWIALGAVALAASVVLLFAPPAMASQPGKFLVLLGSYMLANTAMTVIAVPHSALAGDLCKPGPARVELFGWRLLFGNLGLVLGTVLPGVFIARMDAPPGAADRAAADLHTAMVLGLVTLVSAAVTLAATRGRDHAPAAPPQPVGWLRSLASVSLNPGFAPLFAAYLIANIGLNINATTALYYYRYRLLLDESQTRLIIAVFMLVFCLSIPMWLALARRVGKIPAVRAGALALGLMSCVVYPLFPPGNPWWPLLASVVGGISIGAVVLLEALLADVVDHDRLRSGESRFGLYFGVWKMGAKASRAVAIAISGNLLALVGFTANVEQGPAASLGLALVFGPCVGAFLIAAALVLGLHRLDESRHARVMALLERRRLRCAREPRQAPSRSQR
jgi:GPH family glycoside/pentoside/hexuronide:cation symporter